MHRSITCGWLILIIACAAMISTAAVAAVPSWDIDKMKAAAPDTPPAEPQKERKLLVFTLTKGFRHDSIPHGVEALRIMGEKTGAYTIEHSEDPAVFAADNLARFDAICFLNTTGTLFEDEALQRSLMDFVKSGKGIVGIHSATDTFYDWAEYGEMMGGYFDGHPWHEKVTLKIEDPDHPCNQCFEGNRFTIVDEIYQFRPEPYSRKKLRILTSLDTNLTDMTKDGIRRTDGDFAVSWVRSYGEGRVFYCSLGHRAEIYWNPVVLAHYLAGIQFAFGDLEADTTPSAQLEAQTLERLDALLKEAAAHHHDDGRALRNEIADIATASLNNPVLRPQVEARLAQAIADGGTFAFRQFLARQFQVIGSARSVPILAAMLADDDAADLARYALQLNPHPDAGDALLQALFAAPGPTGSSLVGLISSIGERRDERAIDALFKHASNSDPQVSTAALAALGRIGTAEAHRVLLVMPQDDPRVLDARLRCADTALANDDADAAIEIYHGVYTRKDAPPAARVAALHGLMRADAPRFVGELNKLLVHEDRALRATAIDHIRTLPDADISATFATQLPDLPAATQVLLIDALADRHDKTLSDTFAAYAASDNWSVRWAALRALQHAEAKPAIIMLLLTETAGEDGTLRQAARHSLDRLRGVAVNAALIEQARDAQTSLRVEAMRSLAARLAHEAAPTLIAALRDNDTAVRLAAIDALATLGGAEEFNALLAAMLQTSDGRQRQAAQRALLNVASRMSPGAAVQPLVDALPAATSEQKIALVQTLSRLGGSTALTPVVQATRADDAAVRDAAIRALTDWPDVHALQVLRDLAERADDPTHRLLALRGFVRLIELPSNRDESQTLALYQQAIDLAQRSEERKMIIAGLAQLRSDEALQLLTPFTRDDELKVEADQAIAQIRDRRR